MSGGTKRNTNRWATLKKYNPIAFVRNTLKKRRNTKQAKELAKEAKELEAFERINAEVKKIIEEIEGLTKDIDRSKYMIIATKSDVQVSDLNPVTSVNLDNEYKPIDNNVNEANKKNKDNFNKIAELFTNLGSKSVQDINQEQFAEIHEKIMNIGEKQKKEKKETKYYKYNDGRYTPQTSTYYSFPINVLFKLHDLHDIINQKRDDCVIEWNRKAKEKYGNIYSDVLNILHINYNYEFYKETSQNSTTIIKKNKINEIKINDNSQIEAYNKLIDSSKASMTDTVFNILFDIIKEFLKKEMIKINNYKNHTYSENRFRLIYEAWKTRQMIREMIREKKWHNVRGKIRIHTMTYRNIQNNKNVEKEYGEIFHKQRKNK